ncbi:adenylyl/phosphoadenylyl-sulfate reductase [Mycobacterium celatum]|uniref:Adenosine 5'-phosphosulfate reductase n=1 Tax=Mycobacterium celatum TaxID=28045 RepID=A0A1X1RUI8_MYCCE|nr:phosphoadenylyl-sulfate reductase [Mycobacterium celatum]ORV17905.1 phosphoadenosine phosphosulfate reductase [Mycobacterium celatum]PIB74704.1 phosphoadenosine phosphosulfate reductase [Mycobacterium celatum]
MSGETNGWTETQLRELAARGAKELEGASATELLRWTDHHFRGVNVPRGWATCGWVVASSMQDAVLVDLAAKVRPGVPVVFLDTGYHFAETIGIRNAVDATYDVHVLNVIPEHTVAQQDELLGKDLFARNPNECCRLRKVAPLSEALRGFDEQFRLVKVNPLAAWSDRDMADYIAEHDVLVNPLVYEGYPSIGCAPCTAKPAREADPRSGRWQGLSKTECGLHAS